MLRPLETLEQALTKLGELAASFSDPELGPDISINLTEWPRQDFELIEEEVCFSSSWLLTAIEKLRFKMENAPLTSLQRNQIEASFKQKWRKERHCQDEVRPKDGDRGEHSDSELSLSTAESLPRIDLPLFWRYNQVTLATRRIVN